LTEKLNKALSQLNRLSPIDREATILALMEKRKTDSYVRFWEPHPGQYKILAGFKPGVKLLGALGGNRSGKTEAGAFLSVAWALGKEYFKDEPAYEWIKDLPIPEPPNNIWMVGLDFPTVKSVIWDEKLIHGRKHPPLLPKGCEIKEREMTIRFPNGSQMQAKSADSGWEKFQGASVDLVWIDEECEASVFNECWQRTLDCAGRLLLTLTPLVDTSSGVREPWVFDLYEDYKKGNTSLNFVQISLFDNPFVPEAEKELARAHWQGHVEEEARLYGKFIRRSGLVYPEWDPIKHIVKPFRLPTEWQRIVSIDPAATGITAAIWSAISAQGDIYLYREYYERDRIVSQHAKDILMRTGSDMIDIWLLDPTWGRQRGAENHKENAQLYRESGIPIRLPDVGDDFGLNVSREYLHATTQPNSRQPKVYIFEGLPNFRYEIEHYTWDSFAKGEQKGLSKDKPRKRNDHLLNAWQYLCAIRPRGNHNKVYMTTEAKEQFARLNSYS
jgi:phage terminase large subunit-like protein